MRPSLLRTTPLRTVLFGTALLASPGLALAADAPCAASAPRALALDLAGARSVMFEVNSHTLHLDATPGAKASLDGRACAARAEQLDDLKISQQRDGDHLLVRLEARPGSWTGIGNSYAYLDMHASVPDDVLVQLKVGSGDAWATGAATLSADVGSGDVEISAVKGTVTAKVGSGDLKVDGAGALKLLALGSGDARIGRVRGAVTIGSIGSGDVDLHEVGPVDIGTLGSGDIDIRGVKGSVSVATIGSGDLDVRDVSGDLRVQRKGSGDIDHSGIGGSVSLPRKD
jgi:hypothetical protein